MRYGCGGSANRVLILASVVAVSGQGPNR